ncbi:tRNA (adenosine(37)-N6)-threonylcarbamoyltransferase complex dimerization subunit type 1 TsaB [Treponema socranskii]|uniref:tRNA (adenosine(37)-N6)-threonylcarbamoyltransferase complex dimerization subunit type 1 TsaB n=1 Tax=Treponema socranskii TaxID=53419 RepID=UPI003D93A381
MKALAIDSAGTRLTVAAKNDDAVVSSVYDIGMKQSETILPAIDAVVSKAGLRIAELDYTALCRGPGSFTGLRLAFAALKAVEQATGAPIYGISTLEVYAYPYRALPFPVVSVIDAKKNRFYAAIFESGTEMLPPGDYEIETILRALQDMKEALCTGPDAKRFAEAARQNGVGTKLYALDFSELTTDSLFALAEAKIAAGEKPLADFDGPVYIRASEAEVKRKEIV